MNECTICGVKFSIGGYYIFDNNDVAFCSEKHRKKWHKENDVLQDGNK